MDADTKPGWYALSLDLDAIKARLEAVRPPWTGDRGAYDVKYEVLDAAGNAVIRGCNGNHDPRYGIIEPEDDYNSPVESFILHAPTDIAALVAEVERLRAVVADLEGRRVVGAP